MEAHSGKDMTFNSIPNSSYIFLFLRDVDKVIQNIFLYAKRYYFHRKILRDTPVNSQGGLWNSYGAGIYFSKIS